MQYLLNGIEEKKNRQIFVQFYPPAHGSLKDLTVSDRHNASMQVIYMAKKDVIDMCMIARSFQQKSQLLGTGQDKW